MWKWIFQKPIKLFELKLTSNAFNWEIRNKDFFEYYDNPRKINLIAIAYEKFNEPKYGVAILFQLTEKFVITEDF